MKYLFLILLSINFILSSSAQDSARRFSKPPIDTSSFSKWQSVRSASISDDGNYCSYKKIYTYNRRIPTVLVIQSIHGAWKEELQDARDPKFTSDSRKLICLISKDSLYLIELGNSNKEFIPHVRFFQLFRQGRTEWLAYQTNSMSNGLVLRNLATGIEESFSGVNKYILSQDGKVIILDQESNHGNPEIRSLNWVNIIDGSNKIIWSSSENGTIADNLVLDPAGDQLAFRVEDRSNNNIEKSFWYYKAGTDTADLLADDESSEKDSNLGLAEISNFTLDGDGLFISLEEKYQTKAKPEAVQVDVWSYHDTLLQSEQLNTLGQVEKFKAIISINDHHILRLQQKGEKAKDISNFVSDNFVFMDDCKGNLEEMEWSAGSQPSSYIVSTKNGERKHLNFFLDDLSPDGNFLIGHDRNENLLSYEILTGRLNNISKSIPVPVYRDEYNLRPTKGIRSFAWLSIDKPTLLLYDKFDIWSVDLSGNKAPINITNDYGRKNNIELRLANESSYYYRGKTIIINKEILLHAFNLSNKNEGFYQLSLNSNTNPQLLTIGPYDYRPIFGSNPPIKAKNSSVYLLMRSCATESPNYYWTSDFKTMHPLSKIFPEKEYNWLTTSLVHFKTLDNHVYQGVLVEPENLARSNKYPVIINYYEQASNNLNKFLELLAAGDFSIPWFVSRGYIVFLPDIHYKIGKDGQSALNAIMGCTFYLSSLPWVAKNKIGLLGQSFGAFETNYIVTHTNRFAAAISSSGTSDVISEYGSLWYKNFSKQNYWEDRQGRMGGSLWHCPGVYIENSPIFHIDRITTPLLMVANKEDGNVPFEQGLELFLALRRLGKKSWMLQYDGLGHGLEQQAFIDFTIRSQQFFDYYLKAAQAPKWMIEGIPASMKGIDDGLELDPPKIEPGLGLLLEKNK